jgi:hypothetical protein
VKPVDKVLDRLEGVRHSNGSWKGLCPNHEDSEPSLSISEGDDGRALLNCFAGCATTDIVTKLGLKMSDLFESSNGHRKKFVSTPLNKTATLQRCTLKDYSEAKGLPKEFLEKLGLVDRKYQSKPAVRIPYLTEDGLESAVRFRIALEKPQEGDERFRWRTGSKAMLYGLWHLEKIRKAGWVVLVEGESDTQTLWYHGIPALGVPGADTWKMEWAGYLDGVERIYVVVEPDKGGETLRDKIAGTSAIRDRVYLVNLSEEIDPSSLYLSNREGFKDNLKAALKDATSLVEALEAEREAESRKAWAECEELVFSTTHPGSLRPGPCQSRCSRREQARKASISRRDVETASEAGQCSHERSFVWRQELRHRASAGVLPRRGVLRPHGDERARTGVLRGASVSQVPGHIRGRRAKFGLSDLPHTFTLVRRPPPLRDDREDQRRHEAAPHRAGRPHGADSHHHGR